MTDRMKLMKLIREYGQACRKEGSADLKDWEEAYEASRKAFDAVLDFVYPEVPLEAL